MGQLSMGLKKVFGVFNGVLHMKNRTCSYLATFAAIGFLFGTYIQNMSTTNPEVIQPRMDYTMGLQESLVKSLTIEENTTDTPIFNVTEWVNFKSNDEEKIEAMTIQNEATSTTTEFSRTTQCDSIYLSVRNTSDTEVLNSCSFPNISMNKQLDTDINFLNKISLPFLDNYKNPCWYERLPSSTSTMYRVHVQMFKNQAKRSYDVMRPIINDRIASGHMWRIRCLPLVYVIGVIKCGTTDLWSQFMNHSQLAKPATKEPMFWNINRWNLGATFADYLDLFDEAAEDIRKHTELRSHQNSTEIYHPKVTMDMSVATLFQFNGAHLIRKGYIAAHLIRNLTPDAKIILLIRNPTKRTLSEYLFFHRENATVEEFHYLVNAAMKKMRSCLKVRPVRSCIYDKAVTRRIGNKWVRLVPGMYAPFIRDWLEVFPHMKIYRTEDYHINRTEIFTEIQRYVGLDIEINEGTSSDQITNKGPVAGVEMLPETKIMLDDFYRPFNEELAVLLNDEKYLFK